MTAGEPALDQQLTGRLNRDGIRIHTPEDFEGMRAAGRLVADILDRVGPLVAPGIRTLELDAAIHEMVRAAGAVSATVGYKGYRHASCISVNHVVCHGIPGSAIPTGKNEKKRLDDALREGDILNIDVTVILDGWFGDSSRMYFAGTPKPYAARLVDVTHDALMEGIAQVRPGNTFGDIGAAIQRFAEAHRCSVVRDFCGHGLGRVFHAAPNVLHYGRWGAGPVLEPGMFFTVEPMINLGRPETRLHDERRDDWTAVTRDRSLSAQFEHSVGVTEAGVEIFTGSPAGRFHPAPVRS
jgi:methionyl aminopeptidase